MPSHSTIPTHTQQSSRVELVGGIGTISSISSLDSASNSPVGGIDFISHASTVSMIQKVVLFGEGERLDDLRDDDNLVNPVGGTKGGGGGVVHEKGDGEIPDGFDEDIIVGSSSLPSPGGIGSSTSSSYSSSVVQFGAGVSLKGNSKVEEFAENILSTGEMKRGKGKHAPINLKEMTKVTPGVNTKDNIVLASGGDDDEGDNEDLYNLGERETASGTQIIVLGDGGGRKEGDELTKEGSL